MGWTCDYPLFYVPQRNVQPISDNLSLFKNFNLKPDQLIVSKTVLKKIFSIKLKKNRRLRGTMQASNLECFNSIEDFGSSAVDEWCGKYWSGSKLCL